MLGIRVEVVADPGTTGQTVTEAVGDALARHEMRRRRHGDEMRPPFFPPMMAREADPSGPAAVAVVAPALAAALAAAATIDFRPDDLFIYLRTANHAAEGTGWCFNPGQPANLVSSPLWLWILSALALAGSLSPTSAQLVGGFVSALAVAGGASLAGRLAQDTRAAWAAGIALAADAWVARWFWSGVETGIAAALVTWAFAIRTTAKPGGRRDAFAGLLLAAAALAQVELALLALAALAASALEARSWGWRRVVRDALSLGFVLAAWAGWSLAAWGGLAFGQRRSGDPLAGGSLEGWAAATIVVAVVLSSQALAVFAAFAAGGRWTRATAPPSERSPCRREVVRTVLMLAAIMPVVTVVTGLAEHSRALLPILVSIVPVGFAAIFALAARVGGRRGLWLRVSPPLLTVVANLLLSTAVVLPGTRAYATSMQDILVPLAKRLGQETDAEAKIAAPMIGALGYYSGRIVVAPSEGAQERATQGGNVLAGGGYGPAEVVIVIDTVPGTPIEEVGLDSRPQPTGVYRLIGFSLKGPRPLYAKLYRLRPPRDDSPALDPSS